MTIRLLLPRPRCKTGGGRPSPEGRPGQFKGSLCWQTAQGRWGRLRLNVPDVQDPDGASQGARRFYEAATGHLSAAARGGPAHGLPAVGAPDAARGRHEIDPADAGRMKARGLVFS